MKLVILTCLFLTLTACKQEKKEVKKEVAKPALEVKAPSKKFPDAMTMIFDAHGGLEHWKSKRSMSFELPDKEAPETHYVDLYSRNGKIETRDFSMGFDGQVFWILDEKEIYKGDPVFYHNLMFYFYAMPFVLADDGIQYGETEPLPYEGKSYPGIRISYDSGVGTSPKDEYFIHYNPETHQMEWLGYTVTYRSGEKSSNVKWIRYDDWMNVSDLVLPKSVTWFDYEGRTLKGPRNTINFENAILSETAKSPSLFMKPTTAKIIERKK